jgi:hypothetical protein
MPGDENYGYLEGAGNFSSGIGDWLKSFSESAAPRMTEMSSPLPSGGGGNYDRLGIPMTAQNTYAFDDAVGGRPQSPDSGGLWGTLNNWADKTAAFAGSNLGKGVIGGGSALAMYYLQKKKLEEIEANRRRGLAEQDARRAAQQQATAPMNFEQNRKAVGRGNWGADTPNAFTNNSLSSMTVKAAEGGSFDDLLQALYGDIDDSTQYLADGGQPNTSIGGFLRYLMNNRQIPDTPEEKQEKYNAVLRARADEQLKSRMRPVDQDAMDGLFNRESRTEQNQLGEPKRQMAQGGLSSYVRGGTSGQDDKIPAMLSDGEYVMDADTVSSLGDGNNAAGAKKLDKMRVGIRTHKRSAPPTKIPPKAKKPEAYLRGAK